MGICKELSWGFQILILALVAVVCQFLVSCF
jgi:hypothetical protein